MKKAIAKVFWRLEQRLKNKVRQTTRVRCTVTVRSLIVKNLFSSSITGFKKYFQFREMTQSHTFSGVRVGYEKLSLRRGTPYNTKYHCVCNTYVKRVFIYCYSYVHLSKVPQIVKYMDFQFKVLVSDTISELVSLIL